MAGDAVASWAYAERPPHDALGAGTLTIAPDGDEVVVTGVKAAVEAAVSRVHIFS